MGEHFHPFCRKFKKKWVLFTASLDKVEVRFSSFVKQMDGFGDVGALQFVDSSRENNIAQNIEISSIIRSSLCIFLFRDMLRLKWLPAIWSNYFVDFGFVFVLVFLKDESMLKMFRIS